MEGSSGKSGESSKSRGIYKAKMATRPLHPRQRHPDYHQVSGFLSPHLSCFELQYIRYNIHSFS